MVHRPSWPAACWIQGLDLLYGLSYQAHPAPVYGTNDPPDWGPVAAHRLASIKRLSTGHETGAAAHIVGHSLGTWPGPCSLRRPKTGRSVEERACKFDPPQPSRIRAPETAWPCWSGNDQDACLEFSLWTRPCYRIEPVHDPVQT